VSEGVFAWQKRGPLIAGCFAVLVSSIALTLPAAINGAIQAALHPSGSQLTWVTDGVIVPSAVLGLSFGRVGDLWGRRRLMIAGLLTIALGGLIALVAHSIQVLWIGQAVEGIGVAAVLASSLALVTAATSTAGERAKTIATWSGFLALGNVGGPLISGSIVEHAAWRWSFLPLIGLGIAAAIVAAVAGNESRSAVARRLDLGGQLLIGGAVLAACWGTIEGPTAGWASGSVAGAYILAAVLLAAFLAIERPDRDPIINLGLFRSSTFSCSGTVAVLGMLAFVGTLYLASVLLGVADQLSPFQVALHLLPSSLLALMLRPALSRVVAGVSTRWVLGLGTLPLAFGDFWLAHLHAGQTGLAQTSLPLLFVGIGFAFLITGITSSAVNSAPIGLAGMASGASTMLRQVGQALGPAVLGAIALSRAASTLTQRLPASHLPPPLLHAAEGIAAKAGVTAVAAAPLGPASKVAAAALARGVDLGFVVGGIAMCLAAVLALAIFRDRPGEINLATTVGVSVDVTDGARRTTAPASHITTPAGGNDTPAPAVVSTPPAVTATSAPVSPSGTTPPSPSKQETAPR
jgi:MFS family permease